MKYCSIRLGFCKTDNIQSVKHLLKASNTNGRELKVQLKEKGREIKAGGVLLKLETGVKTKWRGSIE